MFGHVYTTQFPFPHALKFFESDQEGLSVGLELDRQLNNLAAILFERLFFLLLDGLVICPLIQAV